MKTLGPKENTFYVQKHESEVGEFIDSNKVRYGVSKAVRVAMPDNADETLWQEVQDFDGWLIENDLVHNPLSEEEVMKIMEAKHFVTE